MMKIKIVIKRWAYGLKARSLCPSKSKRLDSSFALLSGSGFVIMVSIGIFLCFGHLFVIKPDPRTMPAQPSYDLLHRMPTLVFPYHGKKMRTQEI
ncbi:MAG: hypothetical protein ACETWK_08305 [Candidatus Aminicenantaceae bacterium]